MNSSKEQDHCRICNSSNLYRYLDLGRAPLANSYLREEELALPEFIEELTLQVCTDCGLSQLTKVVEPDLMFRNYLYVSSTTQTFRDHCAEMASTLCARAGATKGELVIDIASNDGCLLSKFQAVGMTVLGVDPAVNLAKEANDSGVHTLCTYWSAEVARDIVKQFGRPKIITATNVFAHVDDVHGFLKAVGECLAPKGIFVAEFPYLLDFIEKNEFDTTYHEHLSYIAISPMQKLVRMHGFELFDVEYFKDLHGGTVRVYVARAGDFPVSPNVQTFVARENEFGLANPAPYESFARRIQGNKTRLRKLLNDLSGAGKSIWAYGASAKGNTLTTCFEIGSSLIPVVIDDNPKKWGFYTPGSHMRITNVDELARSKVDYLLLLAWNFQAEIMRRCRTAKYKGDFIIPVPNVNIIHSGI